MSQLICENLTLGYEGRNVIENLNFRVNAGDYLCIVGENGAGKSTLIKALLGLKAPTAGSVTFGDGLQQNEIGYLPQQTPVQKDFPASVQEIVRTGVLSRRQNLPPAPEPERKRKTPRTDKQRKKLEKREANKQAKQKKRAAFREKHPGLCAAVATLNPFYTRRMRAYADAQMERMGITHLKNRCYRELSGGQQQRVLLARALCAAEKMILLDEPVAGLDPKVTQEMYELIADLNRGGVTVIMVSHDIAAAVRYASHVLHVSKTHMFFGTKESYLASEIGKTFTGETGGDRA